MDVIKSITLKHINSAQEYLSYLYLCIEYLDHSISHVAVHDGLPPPDKLLNLIDNHPILEPIVQNGVVDLGQVDALNQRIRGNVLRFLVSNLYELGYDIEAVNNEYHICVADAIHDG